MPRLSQTPVGRTVLAAAGLLGITAAMWVAAPPGCAHRGELVVTISSPNEGATVSGTTTVTASVTIVGGLTVRGVQFKVDGVNVGAEDTSSPYSIAWNTRTASNGSHTITAVARDLLGAQW